MKEMNSFFLLQPIYQCNFGIMIIIEIYTFLYHINAFMDLNILSSRCLHFDAEENTK